MKYIVSFVFLFFVLMNAPVHAGIFDGDTYAGFGLSTFLLNGDNPANKEIFPKENEGVIGGGFPNWQSGISLKGMLSIDPQRVYRIPFSFDYYVMRGVQRLPDKYYTIRSTHIIQIPTLSAGFEYAFANLPLANAKVYAGADVRCSFVLPTELEVALDYSNPTFPDTTRYYGKDAATRLGMALRIGIDGEIAAPWYVNISIGYNAFNLIGRDALRGELFTPSKLSETQESIIGSIIANVMVQCKL